MHSFIHSFITSSIHACKDVWFHVDKLSSAHVYLRLRIGETLDDVKPSIVMECAQLVKANSIEGCKLRETDVVYTLWSNLLKTTDMDVGQIGYYDKMKVQKVKVVKDNSIVNRISKTKTVRVWRVVSEAINALSLKGTKKQKKKRTNKETVLS